LLNTLLWCPKCQSEFRLEEYLTHKVCEPIENNDEEIKVEETNYILDENRLYIFNG